MEDLSMHNHPIGTLLGPQLGRNPDSFRLNADQVAGPMCSLPPKPICAMRIRLVELNPSFNHRHRRDHGHPELSTDSSLADAPSAY
jgi:hypothetical protein